MLEQKDKATLQKMSIKREEINQKVLAEKGGLKISRQDKTIKKK